MKQIQLYIENQRVELFKDESIVLTQTVQNVKDVGKVFTPFTRSFTLPASKTNNKIFKHYYNINIIGSVDPRLRMDARIDLNHSRFEKGKIKLDGVNMKDNKPDSYKVTFFGGTVTLKDKFRNDKLDQLTFLKNFQFEYNSTNVINTLQNGRDVIVDGVTYEDAFVVPLITHEDRLFYDSGNPQPNNLFYQPGTHGGVDWEQLKPALRIDLIIKAIEKQYDIQFSDHFFNETNPAYFDLRMWMHRKKGQIKETTSGNDMYISSYAWAFQTWGNRYGFQVHGNGYTMRNVVQIPNWSEVNEYQNANSAPDQVTEYKVTHTFIPDDLTLKYTVVIKKDGVELHRAEGIEGRHAKIIRHTSNGNVVVEVQAAQSMTFQPMPLFVHAQGSYSYDTFTSFESMAAVISPNFTFDTTREIPEIKVIDFLSGLFKMFNLVAYLDFDETIIVRTLDSWYAESDNTFDITKHVDTTQSTIDVALPYREILFDYAGKESFFAKNHNALFNYQHGVERYRGEDDELLSGADYKIQLPFEHHKFERLYSQAGTLTDIQWGWSVDDNKQSILGKPLLFYPIYQTNSTQIAVQRTTSTHDVVDKYWIPSNSRSIDSSISQENLNFKAEVNEYSATVFTDTLFSKYYRKYISETFDPSRRLTKLKARLPMSFLLNYELNDLVIVFTRVYRINSIQTNLSSGISNLELINVPESIAGSVNETPLYIDISGSLGSVDTTDVKIDIDDNYQPQNYP